MDGWVGGKYKARGGVVEVWVVWVGDLGGRGRPGLGHGRCLRGVWGLHLPRIVAGAGIAFFLSIYTICSGHLFFSNVSMWFRSCIRRFFAREMFLPSFSRTSNLGNHENEKGARREIKIWLPNVLQIL